MEDLLSLVEQTNVLFSQFNNTVLYVRRFSLLSALSYRFPRRKELLREALSLLLKNYSELFMQTFREYIIKITNSNRKTLEVFRNQNKKTLVPFLKNPNIKRETLGGIKLLFWKFTRVNKDGTTQDTNPTAKTDFW